MVTGGFDTVGYHTRIAALPGPIADRALHDPLTRRLLVTNAGSGGGHYFDRPDGADYAILHVCVRGSGWLRIDGRTHPVQAGSAFFIPRGVPNVYGPGSPPWSNRWCTLLGSDLVDFANVIGVSPATPVVTVSEIERAAALVDEMVDCYEKNVSRDQLLRATSAAWRLMTLLAVDRSVPGRDDALARAMDYLAERLDSDIGVAEIAAAVGVSTSHLGALFRSGTGAGVLAYRTGLRMTRARQLLDTTSASIADIARSVGFGDPYYFSRFFRREHGMSPREFRRRERI